MRHSKSLIVLVALLPLAGCAKVGHVSGTVVEDGQPYQQTDEMVALTFTRIEAPSISVSVSVQKNGSFVVYGPNNEGLPPGKYKVGYYSDIEGGRKKRIKDMKPDKTPLELDLAAGDRVKITVDLAKGTLTRE
ncbi:MAG: hypothetical protein U0746_19050 [Gemmataceae bacterium]